MSYVISPSEDGKYIVVTVQGEISRVSVRQQHIDTFALARSLNVFRILVDVVDAPNTDTIADQYDFAYKDMRQVDPIERSARIAILAAPDDHSHDFIETVGRNSGLNMKLFRDRTQAIAHLLAD